MNLRLRDALILILLLVPLLRLVAEPGISPELRFQECTEAAGLPATQRGDGPPVVNAAVSGGSVADFDNDGWQDVFYASGGTAPDALYINNGDGTLHSRDFERAELSFPGLQIVTPGTLVAED